MMKIFPGSSAEQYIISFYILFFFLLFNLFCFIPVYARALPLEKLISASDLITNALN